MRKDTTLIFKSTKQKIPSQHYQCSSALSKVPSNQTNWHEPLRKAAWEAVWFHGNLSPQVSSLRNLPEFAKSYETEER